VQDETKHRLELLKIARQQLNNQYIKDRADAYTRWSTDCDQAWRENGIKLPFPSSLPQPAESDIVAYALALYNAQNPQPEPVPEPQVLTVTVTELAPPAPLAPETVLEIEPPIAKTISSAAVAPAPVTVADLSTPIVLLSNKDTIDKIFNTPSSNPTMVANETPAPSVVPLIKSMLKKGLLPSWIKTDEGAKE
jgi:hypothetical protein